MAYKIGETKSTSVNLGKQQVTINPYQELTSLNANKIILGLFEPGVYDTSVDIGTDGTKVTFTIASGTTLVFEKVNNETESDPLIGKVYLQEDAVFEIEGDTLWGAYYGTSEKLLLIATWEYDVNNSTEIFADFTIEPDTSENRTQISTEGDLLLGVVLNYPLAKAGFSSSYLHMSYEGQSYRNVMKNLYEIASGYPISYGYDGLSITVGSGNSFLGDTYIYNFSTLTCDSATNWPVPISPTVEGDKQIDFLRLKTEREDSPSTTPYLGWESFLINTTETDIKKIMDGFNFTFKDFGINLLVCVRVRSGLTGTSEIWPENCLILNPLLPQYAIPEILSRFRLPVY